MNILPTSTAPRTPAAETFKIWCEYNFTKEEISYDLDDWLANEDGSVMVFVCEEDAVFVADILTKQAQSFHADKPNKPTYTVKRV